jgi:neutral trehalase
LQVLGDAIKRERYEMLSQSRKAAMQDLMWDNQAACWRDLLLLRPADAGDS